MRRKYAAMMLGLALTLSSITAYAEAPDSPETVTEENASPTEEASGDEASDAENEHKEIYGEITEIAEDSITLSTGTWDSTENTILTEDGAPADPASEEATDTASDTEASEESAETASDTEASEESTEAVSEEASPAESKDTMEESASEPALAPAPGDHVFVIDGGEQTLPITEDTLFFWEAAPMAPEKPENEDASTEDAGVDVSTEDADVSTDESAGVDASTKNADVSTDESADVDISAEDANAAIPSQPAPEPEEISFADLQTGDIVKVTLDEDGNAASITVVLPVGEMGSEESLDGEAPEVTVIENTDGSSSDAMSEEDVSVEETADTDAE